MKPIIFVTLLLVSYSAIGQTNCRDMATGVFYYYPNKSKDQFVLIRDKAGQREINVTSNDTTFWKINWQTECRFTQQFLTGTRAKTSEEKEFYNAHVVISEITGVTNSYYLFTASLDSLHSAFTVSDTAWFSPRAVAR